MRRVPQEGQIPGDCLARTPGKTRDKRPAFFDGAHLGAAPATGGAVAPAVLGARGVQERIRELIAAEDPARPLSDVEVATLLCSEGIEVARRTVAKYRAELGLPAQWRRRSCPG